MTEHTAGWNLLGYNWEPFHARSSGQDACGPGDPPYPPLQTPIPTTLDGPIVPLNQTGVAGNCVVRYWWDWATMEIVKVTVLYCV